MLFGSIGFICSSTLSGHWENSACIVSLVYSSYNTSMVGLHSLNTGQVEMSTFKYSLILIPSAYEGYYTL